MEQIKVLVFDTDGTVLDSHAGLSHRGARGSKRRASIDTHLGRLSGAAQTLACDQPGFGFDA